MKLSEKIMSFIPAGDFWNSRAGAMLVASFASLLWWVIDWCMSTTFRSMGDWIMWSNTILLAAVLTLPYMLARRVWLQLVWLALVDMLLMANLMYCRTYFTAIPLESYALAGNMGDFTASIRDSLRWTDLGFPVILIWAGIVGYRMFPRKARVSTWMPYLALTATAAIASSTGIAARGGFYKAYDSQQQRCYWSSCPPTTFTLLGTWWFELEDQKLNDSAYQPEQIQAWLDEHRERYAAEWPDSLPERRNLVILLLESLESWPIEAEIDGKPITPYLNSLVADSTSLYVPNVFTQVAAGRSIEGQLLITTGLMPMIGTVYSIKFTDTTYPSLPKAMKEKYGAKTMIINCDQPTTWNQEVIARSFGYDGMLDRDSWVTDERIGDSHKLSDGSLFRQSVEKLKGGLWPEGESAMLTFVTYSGHNPWELPEQFRDPDFDLSASGLPDVVERYATMMHYTDSQLHTIIDYLRSRSDWPETLVVITGDHEGLATYRADALKSPKAQGLVSPGQYTPFIVLNSPVAGRFDGTVGQVDLYSAILALTGNSHYAWQGLGSNFLAPQSKHPGVAFSSMTSEVAGDTTALASGEMAHLRQARAVSDAIIRTDYLK